MTMDETWAGTGGMTAGKVRRFQPVRGPAAVALDWGVPPKPRHRLTA
jgi:hypothetical protein